MTRFVIRRVLSALLTLFIIATITFFLMNMIPGGPFNTERASAKTVEMMETKYGLNKPIFEQYLMYLKRLIRLDLGDSYKRIGFSVNQILGEKFPVSAGVGVVAILLSVLIKFFIGFSSGVSVVTSRLFGENDQAGLRRTMTAVFRMVIALGLLLSLLGVLCAEWALRALNCPAEVLGQAALYLRICSAGLAAQMVYNVGAGILRSLGDTRTPFRFYTVSTRRWTRRW